MNLVGAFVVESRSSRVGDVLEDLLNSTQIYICAWEYPRPGVASTLYTRVFATWGRDDNIMAVFSLRLFLMYSTVQCSALREYCCRHAGETVA